MIRWSRRAGKSAFKRTKESPEEWKKFGQKFVFEQKFARKTLFPWEYNNDWDSNQVFRLVPTVLHLSTEKSKEFNFAFVFWKNDESLDVPKETSLFNSKQYT
jgi:hypothetical protein